MEERCEDQSLAGKAIRIIRRQRHDHFNYLQVIWGLLQLNKPEKALEYTREIIASQTEAGQLLYLADPELALALLEIESIVAGWGFQVRWLLTGRGSHEEEVVPTMIQAGTGEVLNGLPAAVECCLAHLKPASADPGRKVHTVLANVEGSHAGYRVSFLLPAPGYEQIPSSLMVSLSGLQDRYGTHLRLNLVQVEDGLLLMGEVWQ